jgi:hypothetical protein
MSDENDNEIKVNIRTGTSSQLARPRASDFFSPRIEIQLYTELVGIDRPINSDVINRILEQSMRDGGLTRNNRIRLNINTHNCTQSETSLDCAVCLQKFNLNEKLCTTNCSHKFHYSCLKEWGKYKQECPLCRSTIPILER